MLGVAPVLISVRRAQACFTVSPVGVQASLKPSQRFPLNQARVCTRWSTVSTVNPLGSAPLGGLVMTATENVVVVFVTDDTPGTPVIAKSFMTVLLTLRSLPPVLTMYWVVVELSD